MNGTNDENGELILPYKLEDCEIDVPKEVRLMVNPKINDDESGFMGVVSELVDYEHPEESKGEYSDKSMKGHAPAVSIIISGKKK